MSNALKVKNLFLAEVATLPQYGELKFEFRFEEVTQFNVGYALNMIKSRGEPM